MSETKKEFPIDFRAFTGILANEMKMLISSFPQGEEFYVTLQKLAEYFKVGGGSGNVSFDPGSSAIEIKIGSSFQGGVIANTLNDFIADNPAFENPEVWGYTPDLVYEPTKVKGLIINTDAIFESYFSAIDISTASANAYGGGMFVSRTITELLAANNPDSAAKKCLDLYFGGYSDWVLPSMYDMMYLLDKAKTGAFTIPTGTYLCTNDIVDSSECIAFLWDGTNWTYVFNVDKQEVHKVLPIRYFTLNIAGLTASSDPDSWGMYSGSNNLRNGEIAIFSGTDGSKIKGSGKTLAEIASGNPGVEKPTAEVITLTAAQPDYTISDETPEHISVTADAGVAGSILLGEPTTDKGITIQLKSAITVAGDAYEADVTLFAFYDLDTLTWTVDSIIDPEVPDYSDIAVSLTSATATAVQVSGAWRISGVTVQKGQLLFLNNPFEKANVGIYQANASGATNIPYTKIAAGTALNVVRVAGGSVYHSEYDGVNLTSLTFKVIGTGGSGSGDMLESEYTGTGANKTVHEADYASAAKAGSALETTIAGKEAAGTAAGLMNIHTQSHAPAGAQENVIEKVKYDGVELTITNKTVEIPARNSSSYTTITLSKTAWNANLQQVVTLAGSTGKKLFLYPVSDTTENYIEYAACAIRAIAQVGDNITFKAEVLPDMDLSVTIEIR